MRVIGRAVAGAVAAVALACTACLGEPVEPVRDWTVVIDGEPRGTVELPARLGELVPDSAASYVLRADAEVPAAWRGRALSLSVPQLFARVRLRVDGELVPATDPDLEQGHRSVGQHIFTVPARATATGQLSLELEVAQHLTVATWFDAAPRLSANPRGDLHTRTARAFNVWSAGAALGALYTIMLTCLVMFAMDRRRTEFGWWAIRTFSASVYCWFVLGTLQLLFGEAEAFVLTVGLATAAVTTVYCTNAQFGLSSVHRLWRGVLPCFIAVAVVYWDSLYAGAVLGALTVAVLAAVFVYDTPRLVRLARRRPRPIGALPSLAGWLLLALLATPDLVQWVGVIDPLQGFRPGAAGLALFALFQFVSLSGAHVVSLRRADELNLELQHQVAERSRQLSEALARLAVRAPGGAAIAPGDVIDDRYEVIRELGAGAMGTVYEVRSKRDGRTLALKVLRGSTDAAALARFAREAQLASRIASEHVVRIFDVNFATSGFMYVVMERVDGRSLKECTELFGEVAWAIPIVRQIAEGLATIHDEGVVHRDLKPANVLVDGDGDDMRIKITDFGIAGLLAEAPPDPPAAPAPAGAEASLATATVAPAPARAPRNAGATAGTRVLPTPMPAPRRSPRPSWGQLTRTGAFLGTPAYMAPELGRGAHAASQASDVFSLGVVAFELLTGARPFTSPPSFEVAAGTAPSPAAALDEKRRDLPTAIVDTVQRAVDADPARRPTARDVARAFAR